MWNSVGGSVGIRVCPVQNKNIYQSFIFVDSQTFSYKKPIKKRHVVTHKKTHTRFLQCGLLKGSFIVVKPQMGLERQSLGKTL